MRLSLSLSLLVLPHLIMSNPIDPVSPPQQILTTVEDTALLTANKWELKSFPGPRCSGDSSKTHNGTSTNACTVLADTPAKSFRFFSAHGSFMVCFYNQKGCAKDNFCGMNGGAQNCSPIGGKGPAVAFKVVDKGEKCIGSLMG